MLERWPFLCAAIAAVAIATPAAFQSTASGPTCKPAGALTRLDGLPEASGLAASTAAPGRLWAHNDSGRSELVAIDANGKVAGRVTVSGVTIDDWEALAAARCGNRTCLYLADIGDNEAKRNEIVVYRVPEPAGTSGSVDVDATYRASYPDGAHDAEALLASSDGSLYVVTKGETGEAGLYRFPPAGRSGSRATLERVGEPLAEGTLDDGARITDGAISPDGAWVALRSKTALTFYPAAEFLKGQFREAQRVDLTPLGEPQGEAVAFGPSNTIYVGGEGGGQSRPGTLGRLTCSR